MAFPIIPILAGGALLGAGAYLFGGQKAAAPSVDQAKKGGYYQPPKSTPKPTNTSSYDREMDALQNELAALRSAQKQVYIPPVPRIARYDSMAGYNKAREMAAAAKNPIYNQKMTDFINRQNQLLTRQKTDVTNQKGALDQSLARLLEDSGVMRARATEDRDSNVEDIQATRAAEARAEGLDFDAAYRAMTEGLGAANMAESGLGQQQIGDAITARNTMSNEQVRQSENKIEAQSTLLNRTFQDLEISDTRNTEDTTAKKTQLDLDLERFIEDQAYDRDQFKTVNELERQAAISQATSGYQRQLVDQWIQSLAGQGYTAEEIGIAASIYR